MWGTKIECGTSPTRELGCGKPANNKKSEECETAGCGKPAKSYEGRGTRKSALGVCGTTERRATRRKCARAVASPKTGGTHQGDLLGWLKKGGGEKVRGLEHQLQPYFREELDWLKNRCTECGSSLSWSPYGQGVCTTFLKTPVERKGGKSDNRKRKRKMGKGKLKEKEKGQEIEIAGERLNVQKIEGQNVKMGTSAEVLNLSKMSKSVSKNQRKGSSKKKTFKGGSNKKGGKGENVRKITAFFESLGNSPKTANQNRAEPKLNLTKLITGGDYLAQVRGGGMESGQKGGGGREQAPTLLQA